MLKRIIALTVIFACSWAAWGILSGVILIRTEEKRGSISDQVGQLWGSEHTQTAPHVVLQWKTITKRNFTDKEKREYIEAKQREADLDAISRKRKQKKVKIHPDELVEVIEKDHSKELRLSRSDIDVDLNVDYRKKGLLWFSTYTVDYKSDYAIENPVEHPVWATVTFTFPNANAVYDNMNINLPDRNDYEVTTESGHITSLFLMQPNSKQDIVFSYKSRGMDRWSYSFGQNIHMVKDLNLKVRTNFDKIDFPKGSISPDKKKKLSAGKGWELTWEKESLVSGMQIGMLMPRLIDPGPLALSMSMHAPVSLFFFFFVMFILQVLKDIKMHPMNYFFLAASFFAFNLLFSYLVNHISIFAAFGTSSTVSILLVVSYMKVVVGARFAMLEAGISQFVYQIVFSLAHFFEGYTGLTITIGAIVTLGIVMHLTARVDWEDVFQKTSARKVVPKSDNISQPSET